MENSSKLEQDNIANNCYYNKIKQLNIAHYSGEVPYYINANLRQVEKKVLSSILKKSKILDVGCGSGRFSLGAAQLGHDVIGIDITPTAISAASDKANKLMINNVQFLVGDMTEIEFDDCEFDFVFCPRFSINAVATFKKRKSAIKEMVRVVKPGGIVYVESFNKFYLGKGPILPLKNLLSNIFINIYILLHRVTNKKYQGLHAGDIVYKSNKVIGAPDGFAHLPTIFELKKLIPNNVNSKFYSIYQILNENKTYDLFKYFRYSIWFFLTKNTTIDKKKMNI